MFVTYRQLGERGRLGNQLFQIAATIGIARANGFNFIFPPWPYAKFFARAIPQSRLLRFRSTADFEERSFLIYEPAALKRSTNLVGFFHAETYFAHCADEIRNWFRPAPALLNKLRARLEPVRDRSACSLHVRRGDYLHDSQYISLADTDYYERAVEQFDADTVFVVFSDDPAWCKSRFSGTRFYVMEGQSDIEDLFLMSLCRGQIIANSSFSWWGAWLNADPQKRVVAPRQWFSGKWNNPAFAWNGARNRFGYLATHDLLPADWIRLPLD